LKFKVFWDAPGGIKEKPVVCSFDIWELRAKIPSDSKAATACAQSALMLVEISPHDTTMGSSEPVDSISQPFLHEMPVYTLSQGEIKRDTGSRK
jgi:hypothetical protein